MPPAKVYKISALVALVAVLVVCLFVPSVFFDFAVSKREALCLFVSSLVFCFFLSFTNEKLATARQLVSHSLTSAICASVIGFLFLSGKAELFFFQAPILIGCFLFVAQLPLLPQNLQKSREAFFELSGLAERGHLEVAMRRSQITFLLYAFAFLFAFCVELLASVGFMSDSRIFASVNLLHLLQFACCFCVVFPGVFFVVSNQGVSSSPQ